MLSPGEWWKIVPKSLAENLTFRRKLITLCLSRKSLRRAVMRMCSEDLLFYVNAFVWQYNPTHIGDETGPFITWEFQDKSLTYGDGDSHGILKCIEDQKDLTIEKSREMGASWMVLIVADWMSRFHAGKQFLMVSRSAEAVDSDSPNSLFWKIDFIHRHLPEWMGKVTRRKMYYGYENGSTITGEASTGRAGVGGRATAMFVDEFAQIREDQAVVHRTSDTTRCRIFNSTHLGEDTAFYELTQRPDMRKLQLHWTMHPEKCHGLYHYSPTLGRVEAMDKDYRFDPDFNFVTDGSPSGGPKPGIRSPWYDEQCERKGSPRGVAMDLDINPSGSVSQYVNPLVIRELVLAHARPPVWEGDLAFDQDTARPGILPLMRNEGGRLKLWMMPTPNGRIPTGVYTAGADIAQGSGKTPSCLSVLDGRTGEKVAEYIDPFIRPEQFAALAVALCRLFCNEEGGGALFAWEMQGPGERFGKMVVELGYTKVYYRRNEQAGPWVMTANDFPGWYPSPNNKDLLLGEYRAALYSRQFLNHSEFALRQFLTFRYNTRGGVEALESAGDDLSGAGINHGDIVVADALAWKMAKGLQKAGALPKADECPTGSLAWRRRLAENERQEEVAWL